MSAPEVSVIVATRNRASQATACIECVRAQDVPAAERQIIVVDDGSSDDSADRLDAKHWPDVTLINLPERQGRAKARNAALALATGRFVVFIDSDAFAPPWFLRTHLDAHRRNPSSIVDGPAINVRRFQAAGFASPWVRFLAGLDVGGEHFVTVNTSCPRETLEKIGGFDPDFGLGYGWEDLELGLRLRDGGLGRVKERRAFVLHEQTAFDLASEVAKQEECGRNGAVFFAKRPTEETRQKVRLSDLERLAALERLGLTTERIRRVVEGQTLGARLLRPLLAQLYLRQRYAAALADEMAVRGMSGEVQ